MSKMGQFLMCMLMDHAGIFLHKFLRFGVTIFLLNQSSLCSKFKNKLLLLKKLIRNKYGVSTANKLFRVYEIITNDDNNQLLL